jgi:hypothetical protein
MSISLRPKNKKNLAGQEEMQYMWSKMIAVDYYEVVCLFQKRWVVEFERGAMIMRAIAKIGREASSR